MSVKRKRKLMVRGRMLMNVPIQTTESRLILVVSVLQNQASAIRMLQARIETIKEYLVEVQEGNSLSR